MPRDDNEKQKRPPGRPRTRAFYNRISFHLSTELHQEMKEIAKKRGVFLEDIYMRQKALMRQGHAKEQAAPPKPGGLL